MGNSNSSTPPPPTPPPHTPDTEQHAALELHLLHFARSRLLLSLPRPHAPSRVPPPTLYSPPAPSAPFLRPPISLVILSPSRRLQLDSSALISALSIRLLQPSSLPRQQVRNASHCMARRAFSSRMSAALLALEIRPHAVCTCASVPQCEILCNNSSMYRHPNRPHVACHFNRLQFRRFTCRHVQQRQPNQALAGASRWLRRVRVHINWPQQPCVRCRLFTVPQPLGQQQLEWHDNAMGRGH